MGTNVFLRKKFDNRLKQMNLTRDSKITIGELYNFFLYGRRIGIKEVVDKDKEMKEVLSKY